MESASNDHAAKVWDAGSGRELLTRIGHLGSVRSVAFSPDGKLLATAGEDNTTKIWDLENGDEPVTLGGHTGVVTAVAFSPNGKLLASASADRTVQIYATNIRDLLIIARQRFTRNPAGFTTEECRRYFPGPAMSN